MPNSYCSMDLERYCQEDFINIPPEDWKSILAYIGDSKEHKLEVTTRLAELAGRYRGRRKAPPR
jgi:hypothetical protein